MPGMKQERSTLLSLARRELAALAHAGDAAFLAGFFKTGPGEYGAGDCFRGIRVPVLRQLARRVRDLPQADVLRLLRSPFHEDRLLALLVWVDRFEHGDGFVRRRVYEAYMRQTRHINNWDLVDLSAPNIAGAWALDHGTCDLFRLARSGNLWERRIAMVATHAYIRVRRFEPTLVIARRLLRDREDLIHKASGWMLREAGKRDPDVLRDFLARHAAAMPRTMLRYAIERLPPTERASWMAVRPTGC